MTSVDLATVRWRKSTYSQQGGNCVEMAIGFSELAPVRDSKDVSGPALVFRAEAWRSFLAAVQAGEFGAV
ncbi:DUF397 domain-containing protein [Kitasatospora sp. NBC_00458]|uniref:DUF397 domain-containing protein n=1 Tax=Kitasatospora sp. NBC_00458 TaxID=2903568 RepID=UPI002E17795D